MLIYSASWELAKPPFALLGSASKEGLKASKKKSVASLQRFSFLLVSQLLTQAKSLDQLTITVDVLVVKILNFGGRKLAEKDLALQSANDLIAKKDGQIATLNEELQKKRNKVSSSSRPRRG